MKLIDTYLQEKLILNKNINMKFNAIFWAIVYNVFCKLGLDNKFIYQFRDDVKDNGVMYYTSFECECSKNMGQSEFFIKTKNIVYPLTFDKENIKKDIIKTLGDDLENIFVFSFQQDQNLYDGSILVCQIDYSNKNYIIVYATHENTMRKIYKQLNKDWVLSNINLSKILF